MSSPLEAHEGLTGRERELAKLSDSALVRKVYDFAYKLDDPLSDEFYGLLSEVFERFAPEAEWTDRVRRAHEDDLSNIQAELEASLERMQQRFAARLQFDSFREESTDLDTDEDTEARLAVLVPRLERIAEAIADRK